VLPKHLLTPQKQFSTDFRKYSNIKFYDNPFSVSRRSSRRTHTTKLIVTCRGFANASKNYSKSYENQVLNLLRDLLRKKNCPRRDPKDALVRKVVVNALPTNGRTIIATRRWPKGSIALRRTILLVWRPILCHYRILFWRTMKLVATNIYQADLIFIALIWMYLLLSRIPALRMLLWYL